MKSFFLNFIVGFYLLLVGFVSPLNEFQPHRDTPFKSAGRFADYPDLIPALPKYVLPSPQAQAITRYGDYPVNYNSGLVDMSVPLYQIKTRRLGLSMNLSFHASGRMADEANGILGMRWVLNSGGIVTRTVQGRPDEWTSNDPYTVRTDIQPTYEELFASNIESYGTYLQQVTKRYDSEYDVFRFILPNGKSGKFILKNENGVKKPMLIPYSGLKVELFKESGSGSFKTYGEIHITDTDGTKYFYGDLSGGPFVESTSAMAESSGPINVGWYLKKIVSADGTDTISFSYETYRQSREKYIQYATVSDRPRDEYWPGGEPFIIDLSDYFGNYLVDYLYSAPVENGITTGMEHFITPCIKSINFAGNTLTFKYRTVANQSYNNKMLDEIELVGQSEYRKFKFGIQLHEKERDIYYLKTLDIISKENNIEKIEQQYGFDYYAPTFNAMDLMGLAVRRQDDWNYYSSSVGTTGFLIPSQDIECIRKDRGNENLLYRVISPGGNVRYGDLDSRKLGMLKSITYPTRGTTTFDYELNLYRGLNRTDGPGIRIKTIRNTTENGQASYRMFRYGENEDGYGYINEIYEPNPYFPEETGSMFFWEYESTALGSSTLRARTGYRVRRYASQPMFKSSGLDQSELLYNVVTEYSGSEAKPERKEVYHYRPKNYNKISFVIQDLYYGFQELPFPKYYSDPSNLWDGSELTVKFSYRWNPNSSSYEQAAAEMYDYIPIIKEEVSDMPTYRHVNLSVDHRLIFTDNHLNWYQEEKAYHENTCSVIGYGFRKFISGANLFGSVTKHIYDNATTYTTKEEFTYDEKYLQLKKKETLNSMGFKQAFTFDYPFDNTTNTVLNKMTKLNMVSTPVTNKHIVNGNIIEQKRTSFREWYTNMILPEYEYYRYRENPEEQYVQFYNYSSLGNPHQVRYLNSKNSVYIWGYGGLYPIAEVQNASYVEILTVLTQTVIDNLNAAVYTDAAMETLVRNTVNKLRSDPALAKAIVTSYTYKTLVGMTSMTDPRGITEYYNYDGMQRLQTILDHFKHVNKAFDYHYRSN